MSKSHFSLTNRDGRSNASSSDELLFSGSIIRFKFCFEIEQEADFMIVDNTEKEFPFQLICITGYKAGTIGGYFKQENIEKDKIAISKSKLLIELNRNFLNFEESSLQVVRRKSD
jgi:hypothetical protein